MAAKKEEYDATKAAEKDEKKDRHSGDHKTGVKQQVKKEGGGGKFTQGKVGDEDCPAPDKGDPNYDSEGEEAKGEAGYPAKDEKKEEKWEGAAAGKYNWGEPTKGKEASLGGEAITKYGWADGKKQVTIYLELEGVDDVADDALTTESGENSVSLTISNLGGKKRRFALANLSNEIDGVTIQRKKGEIRLKLKKKEVQPWFALVSGSGGGGGDDDEEGGGGMGGGMGGMDMASMMGGMGGGGGGMDMASMMGGMGGMGM